MSARIGQIVQIRAGSIIKSGRAWARQQALLKRLAARPQNRNR